MLFLTTFVYRRLIERMRNHFLDINQFISSLFCSNSHTKYDYTQRVLGKTQVAYVSNCGHVRKAFTTI